MISQWHRFSQEQLIEEAYKRSAQVFSAEDNYDDLFEPHGISKYFFFSGVYYFKHETITPDLIARMSNGASLLTVGSGDGHLERLLCHGFNISQQQIHTSDRNIHPRIKEEGFPHYEFDMTKPWPINNLFDYIIFPESLGVATMTGEECTSFRFLDDLKKIEKGIFAENVESRDVEFFLDVITRDAPETVRKYEIIEQALNHVNPQGEIRVKWGLDNLQQRAYVMAKLKRDYCVNFFSNLNNFIVKKEN